MLTHCFLPAGRPVGGPQEPDASVPLQHRHLQLHLQDPIPSQQDVLRGECWADGMGAEAQMADPTLLPQESLAVACESIRRMHADTGSPNILSPLKWIVRQPIRRGHPRLLFLLSHGAISNAGTVLELLRNHSCSTRYGAQSWGAAAHSRARVRSTEPQRLWNRSQKLRCFPNNQARENWADSFAGSLCWGFLLGEIDTPAIFLAGFFFVVVVVLFLFYILFIFEAHLGLDPAASTMGVEFAEKEQWDKQEMNAASSQPVPQPSWSDFFSISLREMKH